MNCPYCNKTLLNQSKSSILKRFICNDLDHAFSYNTTEFTLSIYKDKIYWCSWCDTHGSGSYLRLKSGALTLENAPTIFTEEGFREADSLLVPFIYKIINIKAFL